MPGAAGSGQSGKEWNLKAEFDTLNEAENAILAQLKCPGEWAGLQGIALFKPYL